MVALMLANEPGLSTETKEPTMSEFGQLIEREIPGLRRYARALLRDTLKADDLVQSCLVRAIAKQHLWQPGTDLRAWLFTILHNLHVTDIRRSQREQADGELAMSSVMTTPLAPDARLELLDLDRAIAKLPQNQRQVVLLVGLEGISYEEAANILAVPIGTVRSRLGRARVSLRKKLYRPAKPGAVEAAGMRRSRRLPEPTLVSA